MGGLSGDPTFEDVLAARRLLKEHLRPTPQYESVSLGRMLGLRLWVKYENHQPTVAFKVRGTLNRVLNLTDEERSLGVVTASAGNHGQGVISDEEIRRALVLLLAKTHNLAEGAGAAGTAGVVKLQERLAGKRVGTILSGGNLNRRVLERALTDVRPW